MIRGSKNLPVGSSMRRKAKKGNSTRTVKKTRSTRRYFEVKIRIPTENYARGKAYFKEDKYLSRYVLDAYIERLNRAEANDKAARLRILAGNIELFETVLKEMYAQGKLNFLYEHGRNDGGNNGADYFPTWNPQRATLERIQSSNFRERYKALRNSSSGFIKRTDVKAAVLKKSNFKCAQCGTEKDLQVDHIVSVYQCARELFPVEKLNVLDNLQALCSTCNEAKSP